MFRDMLILVLKKILKYKILIIKNSFKNDFRKHLTYLIFKIFIKELFSSAKKIIKLLLNKF